MDGLIQEGEPQQKDEQKTGACANASGRGFDVPRSSSGEARLGRVFGGLSTGQAPTDNDPQNKEKGAPEPELSSVWRSSTAHARPSG